MKRREFLKTSAAAGAALATGAAGLAGVSSCAPAKAPLPFRVKPGSSSAIALSFEPYELKLRHTFTVSPFSRNTTPDVQLRLSYEGFTGYREETMPPYLGQSVESVCTIL